MVLSDGCPHPDTLATGRWCALSLPSLSTARRRNVKHRREYSLQMTLTNTAGWAAAARFGGAWGINAVAGAVSLALTPWLGPARALQTVTRPWAKAVLQLTRVTLDVVGAQNLAEPAILLVNHLSLIDAVYAPALAPKRTLFVVKRELGAIPLWGWALRAGGAILIDRGNSPTAIERLRSAARTLPPRTSVLVFPEGTRSPDGKLQAFKKGAFRFALATRLPIVVMGTAGPLDVVPHGSIAIRPGCLHVTVSAPIPTSDWSEEQLATHMLEVRGTMERCILASESRREVRAAHRVDAR